MSDFAFFFTDERVVNFVLLFVRLSAIFVFVPFFSSTSIFPTLKASIAFFLTLLMYPLLPPLGFTLNADNVLFAVISEAAFGFAAGFIVQLVFTAVQFAGEQISFAMSFSMASSMDPQSEANSTVITQFIYLLALLLFLAFDGHHLMLLFFAHSLDVIPLGGFVLSELFLEYAVKGFGWMFVLGVMIAFPIIALSLLSDIAFGMIMKTVPSFNLLVVGMPARIFIALLVLTITMGSFAVLLHKEFLRAFNSLAVIFY